MLSISVKGDVKKAIKGLNRLQRQQVPFATARALTWTAKGGVRDQQKAMARQIDRPTPFTLRAPAHKRATKRRLIASVFLRPIQAAYLERIIKGGTRRPRKRYIPVPANLRRNKYGNLPGMRGGKKIADLKRKPDIRDAKIDGVLGLWQFFDNQPPKLLVLYTRRARYRPSYSFYETARRSVNKKFPRNIRRSLTLALRE